MSDVAEIERAKLPKDWVMSQLADLVINPKNDIVDGPFGSNLKASEYTETGAPIVRLQNIKRNNFLDKNIKCVSFEKAEQLSRHSFKPGDLLITKLGAPLGVACIAPHAFSEGIIVADLVRARLPDEKVDTKYITYLINSPSVIQQFKENTKGTTRPRVNLKFMRSLQLPIAPLDQQKQIVAKIEKLFSHIDAGIEALNTAKQRLKQYRQSVLKAAVTGELTKEWREAQQNAIGCAEARSASTPHAQDALPIVSTSYESADKLLKRILQTRRQKWEEQQLEQFKAKSKIPKNDKWKEKYKEPESYNDEALFSIPNDWGWVCISQLGDVVGGLTKNKKREEFDLQLPYLRVANVYSNELRLDDVSVIGVKENELDRVLLEDGDLLIVEGNGSPDQIGRLAIWDASISPCVHQNHLIKVRLAMKESGSYLMYWLSSLDVRDAILQVASSTSGLYTLSISKISRLPVPLPPLAEQIEIGVRVSSKLSAIERLNKDIGIQLLKAQKTKQSILASAFLGKFTTTSIGMEL